MPPPLFAAVKFPFAIVIPEIPTVVPELIMKRRKSGVPPAALRCTVKRLAPGPFTERLPAMSGRTLSSVIALLGGKLKLIVSSVVALFVS